MTSVAHVTSATTLSAPSSVLISSDNAATAPLPVQDNSVNSQNVDKVSQDFEAVFLTQMMQQMFAGDELTSFFGGGTAGEVYKSYFLNEYGKSMAKAGGIGIASVVKQELLKLQEVTR